MIGASLRGRLRGVPVAWLPARSSCDRRAPIEGPQQLSSITELPLGCIRLRSLSRLLYMYRSPRRGGAVTHSRDQSSNDEQHHFLSSKGEEDEGGIVAGGGDGTIEVWLGMQAFV